MGSQEVVKRYELASELWVPASLDEVWSFASEPQNLAGISPPFYGIKVSNDGPTKVGSQVEISMNPFGLPLNLKWISLISEFVDKGNERHFTDISQKGPFSYWRHKHLFIGGDAAVDGERSHSKVKMHNPGTWIKDRVEYTLPLKFLGQIAHQIYVRHSLESMFAYRSKKLRETFSQQKS